MTSDVTPAKLYRFIQGLRSEGRDTELSNYELLGSLFIDDRDIMHRCSRLQMMIRNGSVSEGDCRWRNPSKCLCEQDLRVRQCFIRHKQHRYIIMCGQCCYRGLTTKDRSLIECISDGCENMHRNKSDAYCADCRKVRKKEAKERLKREEVGSTELKFGKRFYHTEIRNIPPWYVKWCIDKNITNRRIRVLIEYHS
jgi:hypothetical protein